MADTDLLEQSAGVVHAAQSGDEAAVRAWVAGGGDVNETLEVFGAEYRLLACAAEGGHEDVVDLLLQLGAEVNWQCGVGGASALLAAAEYGRPAVVLRLLRAGADMAMRNDSGQTALQLAKRSGNAACVDAFRRYLEEMRDQRQAAGGAGDASSADAAAPSPQGGGEGRAVLPGEAVKAALREGNEPALLAWLGGGGRVNATYDDDATLLMNAASFGRDHVVELLLGAGAEIDLQDNNGWTALMYAALDGQSTVAYNLWRHGADIDLQDSEGLTALMHAARAGHPAVVSQLLRAGADMTARDEFGTTALEMAKEKGHAECVRALEEHAEAAMSAPTRPVSPALAVEEGGAVLPPEVVSAVADSEEPALLEWLGGGGRVNATYEEGDATGLTLLMTAATYGHERLIDLLLQRGAAIDHQTSNGWTALTHAAINGETAVVRRLLQAGADVAVRSSSVATAAGGKTALEWAEEKGHAECVRTFEEHAAAEAAAREAARAAEAAASEAARVKAEFYAARQALIAGDEPALLAWLEAGGQVNAMPSQRDLTLLMNAAHLGQERVVELLLQHGAEIDMESSKGVTALMLATACGHARVVELLLQRGAQVDMQNSSGNTALKSAAQEGHERVVEMLLRHSAEVNLQDSDGATALMGAAQHGHERVVDLLIRHGAEVNLQRSEGWTALMFAAHEGCPAVVRRLLRAGADTLLRSQDNSTALGIASNARKAIPNHNGYSECVRALEDAAEAEAVRRGDALLAEIEAEEEAEKRAKVKKGKKKKKGKGGGSGAAGPSQEPEAGAETAAEAAAEAAAGAAVEASEAAAALAAAEEVQLAAALEESTMLEDEARRGADEASGSAPQGAPQPPEPAAESEVPPELLCPLSFDVMTDPVICASGQTYERSAIEKWFAMGKRTDPMSGSVLESTFLVPNVALRSMCRRYEQKDS